MIERSFIQQGIKKVELEKYLRKELEKAGFTKLETLKTPLVTRIIVNVINPGLAIGKSGVNIRKLTKEIEEKFQVENPQLEIKEIAVPELDAQAMADRMAALIERGFSWRSIVYRMVKDISAKGAQGVEILLSGALTGKGQRKRKVRIAEGYMKKVGEQASLVDYGAKPAHAKFGCIGIKVRIVKPETVFQDKIKIKDEIEKRKLQEAKAEEKKEEEEKPEEKMEKEEEKTKEMQKQEKHKEKEEKSGKEKHKEKEEKSGKEKHREEVKEKPKEKIETKKKEEAPKKEKTEEKEEKKEAKEKGKHKEKKKEEKKK